MKRVPEEYRKEHPDIPWRQLAGLRDILIHQYEGVSIPQVWLMAEKGLRPLRQAIADTLPSLEELEKQIAGQDETDEP